MQKYESADIVNVGTGTDVTILELAEIIAECVGFEGRIELDRSKPDGVPRKVLDISRVTATGWAPTISLREGIQSVYEWYVRNIDHLRH